jgi:hypothetical protein
LKPDRLGARMQILAWLFFRQPTLGWRWHATAAFLAGGAVTLAALYYQLFAEEGSLQVAMGHPRIAVEQAIVFKFCGKYGYLSPSRNRP